MPIVTSAQNSRLGASDRENADAAPASVEAKYFVRLTGSTTVRAEQYEAQSRTEAEKALWVRCDGG
jgi:hypothetical protein